MMFHVEVTPIGILNGSSETTHSFHKASRAIHPYIGNKCVMDPINLLHSPLVWAYFGMYTFSRFFVATPRRNFSSTASVCVDTPYHWPQARSRQHSSLFRSHTRFSNHMQHLIRKPETSLIILIRRQYVFSCLEVIVWCQCNQDQGCNH